MVIDVRDLRFSYAKSPDKTVLNIESWSVAEGEHTFVYGPSGAGKSTLLNIISGVLTGYDGQVSVLDHTLGGLGKRRLDKFRAEHIGYVFQQFNLIPYLSAVDNIKLANQFSKRADRTALDERIKHLLSSLNISAADSHAPVSQLSVGQQQRVAIARALINKPELLIADEPTSSLDTSNRDRFMALLMELVGDNGTTLLFVSHDESLSSRFERVQSLADINQCVEVG